MTACSTVAIAYDRLVAEGLLHTRIRAGTYVTDDTGSTSTCICCDVTTGAALSNSVTRSLVVARTATEGSSSSTSHLRCQVRAAARRPRTRGSVGPRLQMAEKVLEIAELTLQQIADQVGYASAPVLREQFVLSPGIPPGQYRRTFGRHEPAQR